MDEWRDIGVVRGDEGRRRCGWCTAAPEYVVYHDAEWGRPVVDDVLVYQKLCLEGFQSGLSWLTILRKRKAFRSAFDGFVPEQVARFGRDDVERLLSDVGIVRHRGKIEAAIANARATLDVQQRRGSRPDSCGRSSRLADVGPHPVGSATFRASRRSPRTVEGAATPGFPLRRPDHLLRGDAVARRRERPPLQLSRPVYLYGRAPCPPPASAGCVMASADGRGAVDRGGGLIPMVPTERPVGPLGRRADSQPQAR